MSKMPLESGESGEVRPEDRNVPYRRNLLGTF
jgi:hypothetical protein